MATLAGGGCVILPGDAPPIEMMLAEQPNTLIALPSLARTLLASPDARRAVGSLREVHMGGEATLGSDLEYLYRHLPQACRIQLSYGQTEVGIARWFVPRGYTAGGARCRSGSFGATSTSQCSTSLATRPPMARWGRCTCAAAGLPWANGATGGVSQAG